MWKKHKKIWKENQKITRVQDFIIVFSMESTQIQFVKQSSEVVRHACSFLCFVVTSYSSIPADFHSSHLYVHQMLL